MIEKTYSTHREDLPTMNHQVLENVYLIFVQGLEFISYADCCNVAGEITHDGNYTCAERASCYCVENCQILLTSR